MGLIWDFLLSIWSADFYFSCWLVSDYLNDAEIVTFIIINSLFLRFTNICSRFLTICVTSNDGKAFEVPIHAI